MFRLRVVLEVLADVDAVVGGLAGRLAAVVARRREPFDQLVFQISVKRRPRKVPHLRREMLQLVRQHPADLDFHLVHAAHEEADLPVPRQGQQRALSQESQRLPVGFDFDGRDERFP